MENKLKQHILSVGTLLEEKLVGENGYLIDNPHERLPEIQNLFLTQARKQNEVILKMIEEKMNYEWATSDWRAALDAIAELIREANRE